MGLKTLLCAGAALMLPLSTATAHPDHPDPDTAAKIQIALLLDTSNSMDGLIDQARAQLWMMVNELADARKDGHAPEIEIALYQYGNSGLPVSSGYIEQISPMTDDLDAVSAKLFSLSTNGGEEYAGAVMKISLDELSWTDDPEDYRVIIIAGNEPFTQGNVSYKTACALASEKGIQINTVHCGDYDTGVRTQWKDGADCSGGIYMNINQDAKVRQIATPYDDQILQLNLQLNQTYIGYGSQGRARLEMQAAQDSNASAMAPSIAAERTISKSKAQYNNAAWDLVDAYEEDPEVLAGLSDDELPEEMKGMDADARKAYVAEKQAERDAVQLEIKELEQKRDAYIAEEREKLVETESTLDTVIITGARKQAQSKGFTFE